MFSLLAFLVLFFVVSQLPSQSEQILLSVIFHQAANQKAIVAGLIMAGTVLSLILRAILAVIVVLFSIFLAKLYRARSFARQLEK